MRKITRVARILVVLLSVFLLSAGAWAQSTLLTEGFEGGSLPTGWSQNIVSGTTSWTYQTGGNGGYPATAHTGTKNAFLYSTTYTPAQKTELITPVLDFTGFSAGRVSFWQAHAVWAGDQDSLVVLYRTASTNPWRRLAIYTNDLGAWTQNTLTVPNISATTQLCFRGGATYGHGVCLDDVLVQGLAYGTLAGTVKNSYNNATIAGATVAIPGVGTYTTSGTGTWTTPNTVLAGPYNITVSAATFITRTVTATCIGNQTVTVNVSLDPVPATITGVVTSCATGAPLIGVSIKFGLAGASIQSTAGGLFTLPVYPGGTNYVYAQKTGFNSYQSPVQITVTPPGTASLNFCLEEELNQPANPFTAILNTPQTAVDLSWGKPIGQYLLIYDDGIQDNWTVWATSGNKNAVKFTPIAYPATVKGGQINIGSINNYPIGSNPLVPFKIGIYDATGPNGTPGALIGALQDYTPTAYGYCSFTLATPVEITSGSFYIAMVQGGNAPNAAGLAIDTTSQQLRSYSQFGTGSWLPASGNFMIRATVSGTGGPLLADAVVSNPNQITASAIPGAFYTNKPSTVTGFEGKGTIIPIGGDPESVTGYEVFRLIQGQEAQPTLWTPIGAPTATTLTDLGWPSLPCSPYLWAVKAQYTGNRWSSATFSNIVQKCWLAEVTVNFDLSCDSTPNKDTYIKLQNTVYTDTVYTFLVTDNSSSHIFHNVWKGIYTLTVQHFAYNTFTQTPITIMGDMTIDATLLQMKFAPTGLTVNNRTLLAKWNAPVPMIGIFSENFASGSFATNQWVTAGGTNWAISTSEGNPAPSAEFNWSPQITNYSVTLTSKQLTGIHAPIMKLKYDIFLSNFGTTTLNQMAVELWDGTTWHLLKNYDNSSGNDIDWTSETLDISAYTNMNFKIRFRAYGEDTYDINNWNVDNISIYGTIPPEPDPCLLSYNFYLNTVLDATIPGPDPDTSYLIPPSHVHYGTPYHACVLAVYSSGFSGTSCYDFISKFLYPPTDIAALPIEDAAYISWKKPVVYADGPALVSVSPRTSFPIAASEYSPTVAHGNYNYTDALWTVLFTWNTYTTAGGEAGIENDATNVYTTLWASNGLIKYVKGTGAYVETFTIPGVTGLRDLASDGQYFYGGTSATSIYKMDFATHSLVSTISTAIAGIRHLAYDPNLDGGNGGFWCGAWTTENAVSKTGATLATNVLPTISNVYGSTMDLQTTGGPFLWIFDQNGNGANLIQYKVTGLTLTATGVTKDASTLPGFDAVNGIAGGLSTGQVGTKLALIGLIQQGPSMAFAYELGDWQGGGGGTPPGLIGYKVYRDDAFLHYISSPDTLHYYDMHLEPGNYCYDVTAWYSLTPYGLPGQFDESLVAPNGPACVNISYGIDLPWLEPFDNGFSFYNWTFGTNGQGNWSINNTVGSPAPCADFSWQPIHSNYSYSIESPVLNAAGFTCADIFMDFDYKLADRAANGKEKLNMDIYLNGVWIPKDSVANNGSLDWTPKHIELKGAKGKGFKIRFRAHGLSTDNILHWYVDNVHVYGVCKAPVIDPNVSQSQFTTNLTWAAPVCGGGGQVMDFIFDDGTGENGWAINPGYVAWLGNEFPIAATMSGVIQQFSVYFQANGSAGSDQLTIEVFDGSQASVGMTDPFTVPTDAWLDIPVNDIPFSGMFYAMVKWNNNAGQTNYLALDEDGPYAAQDLEWYYDGSVWDKIWIAAGQGNPGVYLLRAKALVSGDLKSVVLDPAKHFVPAQTTPTPERFTQSGRSVDTHNYGVMDATNAADSSALVGYNVYRTDETGTGPFTIINTAPVPTTQYADTYPSTLETGTFHYFVTALFQNSQKPELGTICEPHSDTIEVLFPAVGINDLTNSAISIYPNPANDIVNVTATANIQNIEVLNYIGQIVYTNKGVNAKQVQLNVSSYKAGVYFVKIATASGTRTTKITVTH